jgi:hypothetical protein
VYGFVVNNIMSHVRSDISPSFGPLAFERNQSPHVDLGLTAPSLTLLGCEVIKCLFDLGDDMDLLPPAASFKQKDDTDRLLTFYFNPCFWMWGRKNIYHILWAWRNHELLTRILSSVYRPSKIKDPEGWGSSTHIPRDVTESKRLVVCLSAEHKGLPSRFSCMPRGDGYCRSEWLLFDGWNRASGGVGARRAGDGRKIAVWCLVLGGAERRNADGQVVE